MMSYSSLTLERTPASDPEAPPMERTRLSSKGQIVLPKAVGAAKQWTEGTEFPVEIVADGVLLKPMRAFPPTRLDDVAASVRWRGRPRSLADMERAIAAGARAGRDRR